jgi:hypothetical protein
MHSTTASIMAFLRDTIMDERQESPYMHQTFAMMMANAHPTEVRGVAKTCLISKQCEKEGCTWNTNATTEAA